ncbi:MAG: hypothetical protein AAF430_25895 [Myxococcota bacterium]
MRNFLTHTTAFLAGALIATTLASLVWVLAADTLVESIVVEVRTEQEVLATRAAREGDQLAELVHQGSVAFQAEGIGLAWADRWRSTPIGDRFQWALAPAVVWWVSRDWDYDEGKRERGERYIAAMKYAELAGALDRHGLAQLSDEPWQRALILAPMWLPENLREHREKAIRPATPDRLEFEVMYLSRLPWSESLDDASLEEAP